MIVITQFNWKDKNVLITGGTGFLGSHIIEQLIEFGSKVFVVYRSKNPLSYFFKKKIEKSVNMIYCDVKNRERIFDIISKYDPEVIFHLAAQTIVPTAYLNPFETLNTNIIGTINILEGVRLFGNIDAIAVASTDKAYGISDKLPFLETDKLEGRFPYDVSKTCTDLISRMFFFTYNLPIVVTRLANIFGPGDLHFSRIIPGTMAAIIKNESLNIRSDGSPIREYIYIKDVVNGYISLVENIKKTKGEAFNLTSDVKLSVLEVVDKISSILKKKVQLNVLNNMKAEIPKQWLSYEKINKIIGWKPIYSFDEGILETYEWYKDYYFK
ncbi:MAG: GDP-mannose 4,6-dehydratase [Promethearchaeota archaeon]